MKKMHVIAVIFAAFVFSAFLSTSAYGLTFEKADFLINGTEAEAKTPVEEVGEFHFENVLTRAAFTCSGLLHGTVNAGGTGEITSVATLVAAELGELGSSTFVCTNTKTCESPVAFPDKLPFKIEAAKDEGKVYILLAGSYEFSCTVLGIKIEELCESPTGTSVGAEVTNLATDVEILKPTEPLFTCNGNSEEGSVELEAGSLASSSAGNLSVS